jgi:hypothetical protein
MGLLGGGGAPEIEEHATGSSGASRAVNRQRKRRWWVQERDEDSDICAMETKQMS